ncbi:hypothetical protein HYS31_02600 [Candidatus Woesearchaeota archaeon]|nr:hypothetical protein [Candidatus Woesearchaeota archaeon]
MMKDMIKSVMTRERIAHFSILLIIIILYFFPYLNINTMPARGDPTEIPDVHTSDLMAIIGIYPFEIRKTIEEYHQFPFWSPWRLGGTPIFAKPQAVFFYINLPLILFAPTVFAGIKWSILLHFIIAAASMYALMHYLSKSNLASFVAAFAYIFNGYIISRLNWGQTNILFPYAWIPLIFLFTFKSLEEEEWLWSSILVGVFFALEVLGGGAQMFLYTSVMYFYFILIYFVVHLIPDISAKRIFQTALKIGRMSLAILAVFFGLTAVFLLPNSNLMKIGVRSQGFTYEQSLGGESKLDFGYFKDLLLSPHFFKKPHADWNSQGLGLIPSILMLLAAFHFRKRKVLMFILLAFALLLVLNGSVLFYVFWKFIPQFRQIKGIYKGNAVLFFVFSVLAGFGFLFLSSLMEKYGKKARNIVVYCAIGLLIANLTVFNNRLGMMTDIKYELGKNQVLSFIEKDNGLFRFRIFETNGIDWGTEHYSVLLGLNDVYGTENVWLADYLPVYLSFANQFPAKGYGILNTKYIVSTKELNIEDYKFVNKFEECGYYPNGADICQPKKSDGPYLYRNEKYLPRAYFVDDAVLVLGSKDQAAQAAYFLMSNPNFNPSKTVIVHGESINSYGGSFLENFEVILLTGSFDQSYGQKLRKYIDSGGILVPNVLNGEFDITKDKLDEILANLGANSDYSADKAEISEYSPNKIVVNTKNKRGFLVMSEQFSLYPGWEANDGTGNRKEILRSDGVISSVILDGTENQIIFAYTEKSFRLGAAITLATLGIILICLFYHCRKSRAKKPFIQINSNEN